MSSKKNKTQKKINKKKVFIALTICILVALIGGVSVLAYVGSFLLISDIWELR